MNCQAAYSWLLQARATGPLPAEVRRHLEKCRSCRRRHRQLAELENAARELPAPVSAPEARQRLLERLASAPPPRRASARRTWPWWAAACSAMLLVGLTLGPFADERAPAPPPATTASTAAELAELALKHDLRLAEAFTLPEQLTALGDLGNDLQQASTTLDTYEDLPQLSRLYQRTLEEGLLERAARLSPAQRELLLPALLERCQRWEAACDSAAGAALPAIGSYYRDMAAAARQTGAALRAGQPPRVTRLEPLGDDRSLLGLFVDLGLRLARADDPLARADLTANVSDQLVHDIVLAAAGDDASRATQLTSYLDELMTHGVASNLERVRAGQPDAARLADLRRVESRLQGATQSLERNLESAPAPAQKGLRRALDALRAKGRRPGPPDFDNFVPPGLRKLDKSKGS